MDAGNTRNLTNKAYHRLLRRPFGPEATGQPELLEHPPFNAALLATQIPRLACLERRAIRVHLGADPLLLAAAQLLGSLAGQLGPTTAIQLL